MQYMPAAVEIIFGEAFGEANGESLGSVLANGGVMLRFRTTESAADFQNRLGEALHAAVVRRSAVEAEEHYRLALAAAEPADVKGLAAAVERPADCPCWPPMRPPDLIYRTADGAERPIWKYEYYFRDENGDPIATRALQSGLVVCRDLGATVVNPTSVSDAEPPPPEPAVKNFSLSMEDFSDDGRIVFDRATSVWRRVSDRKAAAAEPPAETWRDRSPLL